MVFAKLSENCFSFVLGCIKPRLQFNNSGNYGLPRSYEKPAKFSSFENAWFSGNYHINAMKNIVKCVKISGLDSFKCF